MRIIKDMIRIIPIRMRVDDMEMYVWLSDMGMVNRVARAFWDWTTVDACVTH